MVAVEGGRGLRTVQKGPVQNLFHTKRKADEKGGQATCGSKGGRVKRKI